MRKKTAEPGKLKKQKKIFDMMKYTILFCLIIIFLSSCTMEKRHYRHGLHIEWSKTKTKKQNDDAKELTINEGDFIASSDNSIPIILKSNSFKKNLLTDSCDLIIFRLEGETIKGKVTDIGLSEIKYKRCDNLNGPTITVRKSDVYMIIYANGTKDVFEIEKKVEKDSLPKVSYETAVAMQKTKRYLNDDDYASIEDDIKPIQKKLEGIGLAGFIIILSAIPIWWWLLASIGLTAAIVSFVFGIISMARAGRNKGEFKGRGFGIVSFILGIVVIAITVALVVAGLLIL